MSLCCSRLFPWLCIYFITEFAFTPCRGTRSRWALAAPPQSASRSRRKAKGRDVCVSKLFLNYGAHTRGRAY